jgi:hypothetical protein
MKLQNFARNTYSQTGEDGIIANVLKKIPHLDGWCVEFGAWDGQHLSNTCRLIREDSYSAVLIEADPVRFQELKTAFSNCRGEVYTFNGFVGWDGESKLESWLARTPIPHEFDFLSIDIDGNDYHVWNALRTYRPKVVCIEHNPTIHPDVEYVQLADPTVQQGSSLLSLTKLGKDLGYELIAVTFYNAIFVRSEWFSAFGISDNSPRALREDLSIVSHIFTGMDGSIIIRGADMALWHNIRLSRRIRQIPKVFRVFRGSMGTLRSFLFKAYREVDRWVGRA